jgi:hypothetical protein
MKKYVWTLTILLIVFVLNFSGCSQAPAATTLSASDILNKSSDSMKAVNSFHFLLNHMGGGTPITMGIEMTKAEGDVVRPDKMQATINGTAMGMSIEVKVVTASGKTLMSNPLNGKWESPSEQFQVLSVFDPSTGIAAIIKGIGSAAILTEEQIDGTLCYHLNGAIVSESLSSLTGSTSKGVSISSEIWIGKLDFLVRQVKLTGKITDSEKEGIVRTLTLSRFNQQIDWTKAAVKLGEPKSFFPQPRHGYYLPGNIHHGHQSNGYLWRFARDDDLNTPSNHET